jgi:hypothetical protein
MLTTMLSMTMMLLNLLPNLSGPGNQLLSGPVLTNWMKAAVAAESQLRSALRTAAVLQESQAAVTAISDVRVKPTSLAYIVRDWQQIVEGAAAAAVVW